MSAPEQRSQTSRTTKLSFARPPTRKQDPKKFSQKGMPHTQTRTEADAENSNEELRKKQRVGDRPPNTN